jgi:hypothetical protein
MKERLRMRDIYHYLGFLGLCLIIYLITTIAEQIHHPGKLIWPVSALIILMIVGFSALFRKREQTRSEVLAQWAEKKSLRYYADEDIYFKKEFEGFDCLAQGCRQKAYHIARGTMDDIKFVSFDYCYNSTGIGKGGEENYFSGVILESPILLTPLLIRPKRIEDKIAAFVGIEDINLESSEFNSKFYVSSPDKQWAYDVLHPRMMEFLLTRPALSIQFAQKHVIAWGQDFLTPDQLEAAAATIKGIIEKFPEYLVKKQQKIYGRPQDARS